MKPLAASASDRRRASGVVGATRRIRSPPRRRSRRSVSTSSPAGKSRDQHARNPGINRMIDKLVESICQDRIEIRERNHRTVELCLPDETKRCIDRHASFESDLAGALNDGPVGQGIAERDADLQEVGTSRRDGLERVEAVSGSGKARGEIGDERGTPLATNGLPPLRDAVVRQSSRRARYRTFQDR